MKVLFLDIDGVLNSEASFRMEIRRKNNRVSDTLSVVACSNLQYILEQDASVKVVISSTWRHLHTLIELQNILKSYGVTSATIIGKTPSVMSGDRAHEINMWLTDNPGVTKFVIIDDDERVLEVKDERGYIFLTTPEDGLLLKQAKRIATLFRSNETKVKPEVR